MRSVRFWSLWQVTSVWSALRVVSLWILLDMRDILMAISYFTISMTYGRILTFPTSLPPLLSLYPSNHFCLCVHCPALHGLMSVLAGPLPPTAARHSMLARAPPPAQYSGGGGTHPQSTEPTTVCYVLRIRKILSTIDSYGMKASSSGIPVLLILPTT